MAPVDTVQHAAAEHVAAPTDAAAGARDSAPADTARARPEDAFLPRALAFAALLTFAYLWTAHHLGWKNPLGPGWIAGLLAAALPSWKLVERLLAKEEKERLGERTGRALRTLLRPWWLLAGLYAAAAVLALTVSSVTVIPEAGTAPGRVTVRPLVDGGAGETRELTSGPALRFTVLTSPFGRLHTVRADGYIATPVTVFPLTGARVRLGSDVPPSPSVLLRPSVLGLGFLEDGSHIRVSRIRGDTLEIASGGTGHRGSLLLGRAWGIPGDLFADWERQLAVAGAAPVVVARTMLEWKDYLRLDYLGELAPGDTILAELVTPAPGVVARAVATLGTEKVVDLLLDDVNDGR